MERLHAQTRFQLARQAIRRGWLDAGQRTPAQPERPAKPAGRSGHLAGEEGYGAGVPMPL
jgi:hypothetical protein